jgi:hypothetical protein
VFDSVATGGLIMMNSTVCAGYPHLHRNFRSRLWQTIENAETCPIVFNVLERLKRRLGFRRRDRQRSGS